MASQKALIPYPAYFDHNATTPTAPEVIEAMAQCLKNQYGNAASLHTQGRIAEGALRAARATLGNFLGCDAAKIFFFSCATEINNAVVKGVFEAKGAGHIITTRIEHESIIGAGEYVQRQGGQVTFVPAERDGRVDPERIKRELRPDTILVSVMHGNNETGAVQPVERIGAICREAKVPFHVDAVQTAGKIPVNVERIGCDFLSLTAHKINGPKGAAALYWSGRYPFEPLVHGGSQEASVRPGTVAVHQVVGFARAVQLREERWRSDYTRMALLREELLEGIRRLHPEVVINGAEGGHQLPGTLNLQFPGKNGLHLLAGLDCFGVMVSIGSACTADRIAPSHVLVGMGVGEAEALSSVRLSMGSTTDRRQVEHLLKALEVVLRQQPKGLGFIDPGALTEEQLGSPHTFVIDVTPTARRNAQLTLKQATAWPYEQFDQHLGEVPRDKKVLVVCTTGAYAYPAAYRLANAGHPDVKVLFGGYQAWRPLHPELVQKLCA